MESQLTLIDVDETNWGLDEHIKQVGRLGIARAREALCLTVVPSAHEGCTAQTQRRTAA